MWPTIKFLGTIFISFIAMIGALGAENPFPLFAVAWGGLDTLYRKSKDKKKKGIGQRATNPGNFG